VITRLGAICGTVVKNPRGLETEWIRFAADDAQFEGEGLGLNVIMDEEVRNRKMHEKVTNRTPWWTGSKETAML
jgi:hypothetical protein